MRQTTEPMRRSITGWVRYLEDPELKLTLEEMQLLCLLHMREHTLRTKLANETVEGMVGALDTFAWRLAERMGMPYDSSGEVRSALDAERDRQRALAAAERRTGEAP